MQIPLGYKELDINPLDRNLVEAVWTSLTNENGQYLVLPDGRADLILRFSLDKNNKAQNIEPIIAGPCSTAMIVPYKTSLGFVGFRFRPGMAGLVLNIDLTKIAGKTFYANDAIDFLPELIKLTKPDASIDELIHRLDNFSYKRANILPNKKMQKTLDLMHLSGGKISIEEIAQSLAMNKRTLYRSFTNFVGLPPKTFLSILRFHRALRLLKLNKLGIAHTAFEAGYSDQSHMNKDFKKLGGFTPSNMPHLDLAGFAL